MPETLTKASAKVQRALRFALNLSRDDANYHNFPSIVLQNLPQRRLANMKGFHLSFPRTKKDKDFLPKEKQSELNNRGACPNYVV
jgi:hypothetical protein